MDWNHIYSLIETEVRAFLPRIMGTEEQIAPGLSARMERLDDWQTRYEEPADGACIHFAQYGTWPALSHEVSSVVMLRLTSALQFADFARGQRRRFGPFLLPPFPASVSKPDLWGFLLLDYWHFAGRIRWQALEGHREDTEL